jgi:hypothetical protein
MAMKSLDQFEYVMQHQRFLKALSETNSMRPIRVRDAAPLRCEVAGRSQKVAGARMYAQVGAGQRTAAPRLGSPTSSAEFAPPPICGCAGSLSLAIAPVALQAIPSAFPALVNATVRALAITKRWWLTLQHRCAPFVWNIRST